MTTTLLTGARDALREAEILLAAGSVRGSVSRSYYAMFNAARELLRSRYGADLTKVRKHGAVVAAFGQLAVVSGDLDVRFGRMLNKAQKARVESDYEAEVATSLDDAVRIVGEAREFLEAVERIIASPPP